MLYAFKSSLHIIWVLSMSVSSCPYHLSLQSHHVWGRSLPELHEKPYALTLNPSDLQMGEILHILGGASKQGPEFLRALGSRASRAYLNPKSR